MKLKCRCILAGVLLFSGVAGATDYFVATNGVDDPSGGTNPAAPWRTVNWAVNRVNGGDRVILRGGEYREQVVVTNTRGTVSNPLYILAYTNEVPTLKGADVVTNWQFHAGHIWKQTNWMINSGQVMDDGVVLRQVGWPNDWLQDADNRWIYINSDYFVGLTLDDMTNGTFFCDTNSHTLYVWLEDNSEPADSTMEVSTRVLLLNNSEHKSVLHLSGLAFRYCNTLAVTQCGWPGIFLGNYGVMEDCDVRWCDMAGVAAGVSSRLFRCELSQCGSVAGGATHVVDCRIFSNCYRRLDLTHDGGGMKLIPDYSGVLEGNHVAYNYGPGIWLDTCWNGGTTVIRNNYIHDNVEGDGLFIEVSRDVWIYNNLIVSNGLNKAGVCLSGSSSVRVFNNTVIGNRGIQLYGVPRTQCYDDGSGERCYDAMLCSNRVFNNVFCNNQGMADISTYAAGWTNYFDNEFDFNCYIHDASNSAAFLGQLITATSSENIIGLDNWREAVGAELHSINEAPCFAPTHVDAYPLAGYSPCVDAGSNMDWMTGTTDFGTNARVLGACVDMGAFEFDPLSGPAPSSAPAGVAASDGTYLGRVRVNWMPVADATGYQVWGCRLDEPATAVLLSDCIVTSLLFDAEGLPLGVTNWFWVRAVNDYGPGGWSSGDTGWSSTNGLKQFVRWSFDEGTGSNVVDVINSVTGIVVGAAWTNDAAPSTGGRGSLFFSTSDVSYVDLGSSALVKPTNALTLSVWFKMSSGSVPFAPIVSCAFRGPDPDPGVGYGVIRLAEQENLAYVLRFANEPECWFYASGRYDQWQHAVLTYDREEGYARAYLNGVQIGSLARTSPLVYRADIPVSVGRCCGAQMKGCVDEVRVYSRSLSAGEVKDLYRGLVAFYTLDHGGQDASGNENHGVLYGPQETSGVVGGAFAFVGDHDYVETPDNMDLRPLDALTVSAWFKMSTASSNNGTIVDCLEYGGAPDHSTGFAIHRDGANERVAFALGFDGETDARFSAPIHFGRWHHAALAYGRDSGYVKAYVDGVEVGSLSRTSNIRYNASFRPAVGARNFGQVFRGEIDEVRVYRKALSARDVAALFADTDGDGLADATEVNAYGTDPRNTDSDEDWLSDGDEVNSSGTDPLDEDSDDDLSRDGEEFIAGTDPRSSAAFFGVDKTSSPGADGFVVAWQSVTGRLYTVASCTNMPAPVWTNLPEAVQLEGTGARMSVTNTMSDALRKYYRVGVKRR